MYLVISIADIELFSLISPIYCQLKLTIITGHQGSCTGALRFGIVILSCALSCVLTLEMTAQVVCNANAILPRVDSMAKQTHAVVYRIYPGAHLAPHSYPPSP